MKWKIFFIIFAQAENTTCSDTPEMIQLEKWNRTNILQERTKKKEEIYSGVHKI